MTGSLPVYTIFVSPCCAFNHSLLSVSLPGQQHCVHKCIVYIVYALYKTKELPKGRKVGRRSGDFIEFRLRRAPLEKSKKHSEWMRKRTAVQIDHYKTIGKVQAFYCSLNLVLYFKEVSPRKTLRPCSRNRFIKNK